MITSEMHRINPNTFGDRQQDRDKNGNRGNRFHETADNKEYHVEQDEQDDRILALPP